MYPTLSYGDKVLVLRGVPASAYRRGDVVLAVLDEKTPKCNGVSSRPVIKRIIGLPGDTISISNYQLYQIKPKFGNSSSNDRIVYVQKGDFFLCGDNLESSVDSRLKGAIPFDRIKGIVLCRFK